MYPPVLKLRQMSQFSGGPPAIIQGRYVLEAWLGKGAMGMVYQARDNLLARPVVIKFLDATGDEAGSRFLREAQIVARLTHPNIMSIYDVGEQAGWRYLVLEHIPGGNLAQLRMRSGGRLPLSQAMSMTRQVLDALFYAHTQGVVHRDIKPENILLTPSGEVKLADFGLARAADHNRLTGEGSISGTLLYLAPELLNGDPADRQSDLYALGIVLYELLTGQLPFVDDNVGVLLNQIVNAAVPAPSSLNAEIPPLLDTFILRLLARERTGRYQDADQALHDLEQAASATTGSGAPVTGPVLVLAQSAGAAQLVEAERRRLAELLNSNITEPLTMLLAQTSTFERSLAAQPGARMAFSVLGTLTRQLLQQARDLEASLHPAVLETLGLEPALEALAEQANRSAGLNLQLSLERLPARLPPAVELGVFRWVQGMLSFLVKEQVASAHLLLSASSELHCSLSAPASSRLMSFHEPSLEQTLVETGGQVSRSRSADGEITWTIILPLPAATTFTPREQEVLHCLIEGLSNRQIAARLFISPRTVSYHLDNLFSKLGVRTRTEVALLAQRQGLAKIPPPG